MARRTHHRLHHAGDADLGDGLLEILVTVGKTVGAGSEAQFLGGQAADTLAVHGQFGGLGRGNHVETFLLQFHQRVGSDGLHLRHDKVGLFLLDHATQFGTVQHVDDVGTVGHLHARGVSVAVHGDHFDAETHHLDDDFLAQFAGSTKQHPGGTRT